MTALSVRRTRPVLIAVLLLAALTTLTGCFFIPLADDRSPFDDPFGESHKDIAQALPDVNAALAGLDTATGKWKYEAELGYETSCEGRCNLHVAVFISTSSDDNDDIPQQVLENVLIAAVPAAEKHQVDVRIQSTGDSLYDAPSLDSAAQSLLGDVPSSGVLRTATYSIESGRSDFVRDIEITAFTRENTDVLKSMGLSSNPG